MTSGTVWTPRLCLALATKKSGPGRLAVRVMTSSDRRPTRLASVNARSLSSWATNTSFLLTLLMVTCHAGRGRLVVSLSVSSIRFCALAFVKGLAVSFTFDRRSEHALCAVTTPPATGAAAAATGAVETAAAAVNGTITGSRDVSNSPTFGEPQQTQERGERPANCAD